MPVYRLSIVFFINGLADPDFLGRRLVRRDIINEMVKWRQGVVYGQWRIHESDFIKIDISVPSLAEQRSIGSFRQPRLSHHLHQRKIEHLKLQKRGFLQKMFPKDGADRPEIRLPGFTDPWKRRKLGELASFSKGVGYSKADISETGMPFIHYGRLYTNHEIVVGQVDTFVNPIPGSVFTEGSEVITPSSGETAEDIAIASAVISPGIILGGGLNIVRPGSLLEPIFLALSISYGSQHKELSSKAQGKSVVHLYNDDLKSSSLFYPRIAEQRQIGAFFRQLDSLISLHQRKLEHLHVQKKALLQQMFI